MPAIASLPQHLPASGGSAEEQRLRLSNVSWQSYLSIGEALRDRPALRLTYNQGTLEFMTTSPEHERYKYLLGRLVDTLAEELGLRIGGFGSTTFQHAKLERGLESDQCYYHRNLDRVRGMTRIDPTRHPPPDLAIVVDITRSSQERMEIYASLGTPEFWRFDGKTLQVFVLTAAGEYVPSAHSPTFPSLPVGELVRFIEQGNAEDDVSMVQACRAWVREQPSDRSGRRKPSPRQRRKRS
jgi:Uma2 family endonuclease